MSDFLKSLPHLLVVLGIIGAAVGMAVTHVITGAEAIGVIGTAGGFSLGVSGSSLSVSTVAGALPAVSSSTGGQTTTITPASSAPSPVTPQPSPGTAG